MQQVMQSAEQDVTCSVLAAASWLQIGCQATAMSLAELLIPDGISGSLRAASYAISWCNDDDDDDDLNMYLASRHQVHATQVNSLQTGLFRASRV